MDTPLGFWIWVRGGSESSNPTHDQTIRQHGAAKTITSEDSAHNLTLPRPSRHKDTANQSEILEARQLKSALARLAPQRKDSPFLSQQSALLQSARLMGSSPKAGPRPTSRFLPTISDSSPTIGRGRSCDSSKASFSYVAPCVLK